MKCRFLFMLLMLVAVCARAQVTPIEFGIKILQWGLNQEQSDGSYTCDDYYHSSMFFVEGVSDACLALQSESGDIRLVNSFEWRLSPIVFTAH